MLLIVGGCSKQVGLKGPQDVHISNCQATPDWVDVHDGEQVRWIADDGHEYTVNFHSSNPTPNPFPVKSTVPVTRPIKGAFHCSILGCKYKYSLTRDQEGKPCVDPGIRIVP
jgi:hypothetical protein